MNLFKSFALTSRHIDPMASQCSQEGGGGDQSDKETVAFGTEASEAAELDAAVTETEEAKQQTKKDKKNKSKKDKTCKDDKDDKDKSTEPIGCIYVLHA